jgi:bifunctional non-homologous end joining protein LigD
VSERLRTQLVRRHILKPALTGRLRRPDTKWVEPHLKAKIAFRGITGDGKLRHPSFKGLLN